MLCALISFVATLAACKLIIVDSIPRHVVVMAMGLPPARVAVAVSTVVTRAVTVHVNGREPYVWGCKAVVGACAHGRPDLSIIAHPQPVLVPFTFVDEKIVHCDSRTETFVANQLHLVDYALVVGVSDDSS